jgi:hypothetical protein
MSKLFAQVQNGVVVNVVTANADWAGLSDGVWIEYTDEQPAAIGWAVVDGVAVKPPAPEIPDAGE